MLETLFAPKSIALVGASSKPGKVGHEILKNLLEGGFEGRIAPIHPTADAILGLKCRPSLRKSNLRIDLAVIAAPAAAVPEAVADAIGAGAKAAVVISAGFRETGPEGAALEAEVARLCREANVRLLGPNCVGIIDAHRRLNATFAGRMPVPGGISVVSQSGAVCTAILDWAAERGIGLAKLLSMGNKADISEVDLLPALAADERTKVIVAYLESVESGQAFIRAAEAASAAKPVVALKVGGSEAGRRAAVSHTGSLAGADLAYGAAFARAGVVRAADFQALLDYASAFALQPTPAGGRVAIVTNAGGPGIMAADAAERLGLETARLGGATATALRRSLPAAASLGNPIDVLGDADPARYAAAVAAAMEDAAVDALVVILTPQAMTHPAEVARAIAGEARRDKPLLAAFMGGEEVLPAREELTAEGLPCYPTPERAVAALAAMRDYGAWLRRPPRVVTRFPANRRRVERIVRTHLRGGRPRLGERDAKRVLAAYDFRVPEGRFAEDAEAAADASDRIGYPVAVKIVSPEIVHKTDVGGVRLGLADAAAVRDAVDLMFLRARERVPEATLEGVYVERMCAPGREVILGVARDPQFGPMLMFGLGGVFVETLRDVAFHLAPITEGEALEMLRSTRSFALLEGARGGPEADVSALVGALQRLGRLVTDFPEIAELDINPLIVGPKGAEPVVADARIVLASSPERR